MNPAVAYAAKHSTRVHAAELCAGQACTFHNPSEHGMSDWPINFRETMLIERMCPHGIGHPDPDSAAWMDARYDHEPGTWSVHGCDGCCSGRYPLPEPTMDRPPENFIYGDLDPPKRPRSLADRAWDAAFGVVGYIVRWFTKGL